MKKQISYVFLAIALVSSISYLFYTLIAGDTLMNNLANIIRSSILFIFSCFFVIIGFKVSVKKATLYIPLSSLVLACFINFNLLSEAGIINLPEEEKINNFVNTNISEALEWADSNDIKVIQTYEYSDVFKEFEIISQNVKEGTLLDDVNKIEFIVSNGPNYNKTIIVPNMLSWTTEEVTNFIETNFLINVSVEYKISEELKDIVIEQNKSGELKRNEALLITFSIGNSETLEPIELIDFTNTSLFKTSLWLKGNGIDYKLVYDFSNTIKRDFIISQNIEKETVIDPNEENNLILTISKGKEIIVPDLLKMEMEDITKWIAENNLKIEFDDCYDDEVTFGDIIETNYKNGDIIEEGTLINVITSRGQLKMPDLSSVYQYKEWANKYNITLEEQHKFSDTVKKGDIVELSHQLDEIIANDDKIIIIISRGKAVTIPSFNGKTKSQASSLCKSSNLNCSYKYGSYSSSIAKDTVTYQSNKSGNKVVQGSSITLTLSKGKAQTFEFGYQEDWVLTGSADKTIAWFKKEFITRYPDVSFKYVKKIINTGRPGLVYEEKSPTKTGSIVKQGQTYTIWVIE